MLQIRPLEYVTPGGEVTYQLGFKQGRVQKGVPAKVTSKVSRHEFLKQLLQQIREAHQRGKDKVEYSAMRVIAGIQSAVLVKKSKQCV